MYIWIIILLIIIYISKKNNNQAVRKLIKPMDKNIEEKLPYSKKEFLFNYNEFKFYVFMNKIAKEMNTTIFSKVRLADIIAVNKHTGKYYLYLNKITSKHVDFLICNNDNLKPLFVIELDGSSHDIEERKTRDKFVDNALNSAKMPIFHINVSNSYNEEYIKEIFKTFTNKNKEVIANNETQEHIPHTATEPVNTL